MKYLNETQCEHLGEHLDALSKTSSEGAWLCFGNTANYESVKFKYDECACLMEVLGTMLNAVEENQKDENRT